MRPDILTLLGIVGFAVASMPLYAMSPARSADDPHEVKDRGGFVLGGFLRSWFYWFIGPAERLFLALRLSPTAFNLLGVAFGVGAGYCFATGRVNLAGWAVLLGGVADVFDGRIARAQGVASARGAFLDSTLDRFAEVGAFVGLAVLFRESAWAVAIVATALGGSLLVSYARARGESVGVVCKKGVMQRAERLLVVGFGGILDPGVSAWMGWASGTLLIWLLGVVAVGTVGTAIYRTTWIADQLS
jgi:CDP-diacylglycerol---glycerol-3-phosphate 3-phosphatidyltransferase